MTDRRVSKWTGKEAEELSRRWGGREVHLYGTVGSTNDVARRLADEEEAAAGTVVLAREQTSGRGRAGRSWYSPREKGVYLSMVLRPGRVEHPELLPLLAGLGIVRRLDAAFPGLSPRLKWPNDLMLDDGKVGGVLAEAVWSEEKPRFLVAGVGINVKALGEAMPEELAGRAVSLEEALGRKVEPLEVADAVVEGLEAYLRTPPTRLDREALALMDRYDWLGDRRVRVTLPHKKGEEELEGVCVGIAPDGRLLFRPDRGALRRLETGTVEAEPVA